MVPRIRDRRYEAIEFSPEEEAKRRASGDEYDRVVADVIEASRKAGQRPEGKPYRVFLLSPADDPETERLGAPIVNDLRASTGRGWGWTLHQRYTRLTHLQSGVTLTSELDALASSNTPS